VEVVNQIAVVMGAAAVVERMLIEVQTDGLVINVKNGIVLTADIYPSVKSVRLKILMKIIREKSFCFLL
jgi:hypothetical protein